MVRTLNGADVHAAVDAFERAVTANPATAATGATGSTRAC